jgi:DNA-binding response OmpR family regulator
MNKILIIDRDRVFVSCLKDFFAGRFQVQTANDGTNGLELIKINRPDLIICDLNRPSFYGYQVLKTIRSNPTTAKIPFIVLSCFSEWEERDRALNLGANEFLSKPVRLRKLLSTIESQLHSQEMMAVS